MTKSQIPKILAVGLSMTLTASSLKAAGNIWTDSDLTATQNWSTAT